MPYVLLSLFVSLILSALVVVYVAYPHRGQQLPLMPWLGRLLGSAAERAPVIEHPANVAGAHDEDDRAAQDHQSDEQSDTRPGTADSARLIDADRG